MNRISEALLAAAQKIGSIQTAQGHSYEITTEILEQVAKEIEDNLTLIIGMTTEDAMVTRLMDLRYIELKHTSTRIKQAEEEGYREALEDEYRPWYEEDR